jgi:hypothetical protein
LDDTAIIHSSHGLLEVCLCNSYQSQGPSCARHFAWIHSHLNRRLRRRPWLRSLLAFRRLEVRYGRETLYLTSVKRPQLCLPVPGSRVSTYFRATKRERLRHWPPCLKQQQHHEQEHHCTAIQYPRYNCSSIHGVSRYSRPLIRYYVSFGTLCQPKSAPSASKHFTIVIQSADRFL